MGQSAWSMGEKRVACYELGVGKLGEDSCEFAGYEL